jgi:hypothetical protein
MDAAPRCSTLSSMIHVDISCTGVFSTGHFMSHAPSFLHVPAMRNLYMSSYAVFERAGPGIGVCTLVSDLSGDTRQGLRMRSRVPAMMRAAKAVLCGMPKNIVRFNLELLASLQNDPFFHVDLMRQGATLAFYVIFSFLQSFCKLLRKCV